MTYSHNVASQKITTHSTRCWLPLNNIDSWKHVFAFLRADKTNQTVGCPRKSCYRKLPVKMNPSPSGSTHLLKLPQWALSHVISPCVRVNVNDDDGQIRTD